MKNVKTILAIVVACLGISASASDLGSALPFSRVNHDPATLGMGGASVVNANAYSAYRNAAALSFADFTLDAGIGYQLWQPSGSLTHNISAAGAYNVGNFSAALGYTYGLGAQYTVYGNSGTNISSDSFNPVEMQVNLGLAYKIVSCLSVGLDLKYLYDCSYPGYNYTAFAGDLFLQAQFAAFSAALGVSNLGTSVTSNDGTAYSLPTSITLGAGYNASLSEDHALKALLDLDYFLSSDFAAALGGEYTYKSMLSARVGYRHGASSVVPSFASVGLGACWNCLRIDLAYLIPTSSASVLKNTVTVGVGVRF